MGRTLLRPAFRLVASARSQEVFTASALLVAVGTAVLVSAVGLSMALGAFMAGVLLADSEYRHELEADIEPFRGLLMGLFFISVGMSVALELLLQRPLLVVALVLGMTGLKILSIGALGRRVLRAWPTCLGARGAPLPGRRVRVRALRAGGLVRDPRRLAPRTSWCWW